jgi:hypothetical protein
VCRSQQLYIRRIMSSARIFQLYSWTVAVIHDAGPEPVAGVVAQRRNGPHLVAKIESRGVNPQRGSNPQSLSAAGYAASN